MASEKIPQQMLEAPLEETVQGNVAAAAHAGGEHDAHGPLAAETLMHHVKDADYFHVPRIFSPHTDGKLYIPQFRDSKDPILEIKTGFAPVDDLIEPFNLQITKFMVLEVVGALILMAVFIPLARRLRSGARPRGRLTNLLEAMVLFIRDQVARPTIGSHDGDRFAPFLLNIFFFVLICNLLGLVPWAGSPTGALGTTAALALITFATVVVAGSVKLGPLGFWLGQVPPMDVPWAIGIVLKPLIFVLEFFGLLIKHFVLAMRLLANMMAGHVVLAVLVAFISASGGTLAFFGVVPASVLGSVALSMLELFVAFLQAYIFAFLSGLFIGMAVHPH
ncbi:MAG: F0F1 ATP synthase subunit A [Pirellulaceae bacterium]